MTKSIELMRGVELDYFALEEANGMIRDDGEADIDFRERVKERLSFMEEARVLAWVSAISGRIPYRMMGMDREPSEESKKAIQRGMK